MQGYNAQALVDAGKSGLIVGMLAIVGWIFTTWLRIKNGYPLENSWGMPIHPKNDRETVERRRDPGPDRQTVEPSNSRKHHPQPGLRGRASRRQEGATGDRQPQSLERRAVSAPDQPS